MPDKPILIFPAATVAAREKLDPDRRPPPPRPTKREQVQRLNARFQALSQQFGTVQTTPAGVDPEQVLVLETIGRLSDFQNVVKYIPGMEWLGEFDAEVAAGDPGFLADGSDPANVKAQLFVVASNRTAYNEILRLWRLWHRTANDKLPRPYGKLAAAFKYLNDVRPWGPRDRVQATGVMDSWQRGLTSNEPIIRFEAELWCRHDATKRAAAFARLKEIVSEAGGQCIKQAALLEIDYHGVLLELPASAVQQTVTAINAGNDTRLLRLTDVKYFSPKGQAAVIPVEEGTPVTPPRRPVPTGEPVVALLDGLPMTNHAALQNRLIVDDPDNLAAQYHAGEHRHGTAMASLLAHGEYDGADPALPSKIYVRPVMQPGPPDANNRRWETFPPGELPIDLVHRAVRRMFEGEAGEAPQAANVKVINLSLGDKWQLFDRHISPWARLLDWLSSKYRILFVVSAGNHEQDLTIPVPPAAIAAMSEDELRAHALRAMAHQRVQRRLLAPAESINALTVGALHGQNAPNGTTGLLVDLLRGAELPSLIGSVASGYRRAIKPEILVASGRRHYLPRLQTGAATNSEFQISPVASQPGQLVAAPGGNANPPQHAVRVSGSSNAAVLTTRRAAHFLERIAALRQEPGGGVLEDARAAVILKTMLVHGASWGDWENFIDHVFDGPDNGQERWWRIKRACAQFFGYGPADFDRGTLCTDQRIIVLGCGDLNANEGHVYNVPLPPALSAQTVSRRLTITLAWLTPINPRHRSYRIADLWFEPPSSNLGVKRRDADHDAVCRGTVQHEVLEGNSVVAITDGDVMPIQVNYRTDATSKITTPIPYALMVSLETAQPLAVSIYDQVKVALDRLRLPVVVRAGTSNRPHRRET